MEAKEKTGLVLEGGGMRGIYTAGVLDVFGEHGVSFDGMVGVSAGAIHAVSFLSGQHGRSVRTYLGFSRDPRFMGIGSYLRTGSFVNYPFCYHEMPDALVPFDYEAFEANPTEFYMTTTDVETGEPYYVRTQSLRNGGIDALCASASLPLVSRIISYDGHMLLDGGTSDSVPLEFLRGKGFERCVVVLTQVAGYRKNSEITPVFRLKYRRYPAYVETMASRHRRYNATMDLIERLEREGRVFVFRPSLKIKIRRLERDASRILAMYELGRRDAAGRLEDMIHFLNA